MKEFLYSTRVYFSDTDCGGIVYHTHYLNWAEHARTEMLRSALPSFSQSDASSLGFIFVVREIGIKYIKPALLDDVIQVRTKVERMEHFYAILSQDIYREDELLCTLSVKVAFIDKDGRKPHAIPKEVASALM